MKAKSENKKATPKLKDLKAMSNPKGGVTAAKKTPSGGTGSGLGAGKAEFDDF
jgi:hypothetical protein